MMRGLLPLFGVALLVWAATAQAQALDTPPPPPPPSPPSSAPPECCVVVMPSLPAPDRNSLLFQLSVGPTYRRAFREDFAAAAVELALGAQSAHFGMDAEISLATGATRVGLPYQFFTIGPAVMIPAGRRLRIGLGATFGAMFLQRASASRFSDPTVTAITAGLHADARVDLLRTHRGGALFAMARVGWDFIDNTASATLSTGSSLALTAALGYRY